MERKTSDTGVAQSSFSWWGPAIILLLQKGDYIFGRSLKFLTRCLPSLPSCCTKTDIPTNNAINHNTPNWVHAKSSTYFCKLKSYESLLPVNHFWCCVYVSVCVCVFETAVWTSLNKRRRRRSLGRETDRGGRRPPQILTRSREAAIFTLDTKHSAMATGSALHFSRWWRRSLKQAQHSKKSVFGSLDDNVHPHTHKDTSFSHDSLLQSPWLQELGLRALWTNEKLPWIQTGISPV